MIETYLVHLLILIGIYLIVALAFQVSRGFTGLLNLGHIAFYGIGAYVSALLILNGYPFLFCFLMAGIVSLLFALILATLVKELNGDYFALATMGFSSVIYAIFMNWTALTKGPMGLVGIVRPSILGFDFSDNLAFLVLTFIVVAISYLSIYRIVTSPFGRVLEAIRDDELAAKSLGKNTRRMKSYSLAISAFFAGLAGSLYAHYITFIDPSSFSVMQIIPFLTIITIAGMASLRGTVIATFVIVLLPESLRFIGFPSDLVGSMRQMTYALILILFLIIQPNGLFGKAGVE